MTYRLILNEESKHFVVEESQRVVLAFEYEGKIEGEYITHAKVGSAENLELKGFGKLFLNEERTAFVGVILSDDRVFEIRLIVKELYTFNPEFVEVVDSPTASAHYFGEEVASNEDHTYL